MHASERVVELTREAGFDLVGATPLGPPDRGPEYARWLANERHGSMDYLERNRDRILRPDQTYPEGKSLLMVGLGHSRLAHSTGEGARIARYAIGRDYHNWMGKALKRLGKALTREGLTSHFRGKVDAVPLMERSHAAMAGIGIESKAANLLHPQFGPWFFLGELILDVELVIETPQPNLSCGSCTACIDVCPTDALIAPGQLDARKCISYQTIENRSSVPHDLREGHGDWLFGCDLCSEVCPWGHKAPNLSERFGLHPAAESISLVRLIDPMWTQAAFSEAFQGSALSRPKRQGLARNAALVLGNRPSEEGRIALLKALETESSPIIREASAWALARGYRSDAGVLQALDRAAHAETESTALEGLKKSQARYL